MATLFDEADPLWVQVLERDAFDASAQVKAATLSAWIAKGLVTPSICPGGSQGVSRYWSPIDLVVVRALDALRKAGCPMSELRPVAGLVGLWAQGRDQREVLLWTGKVLKLVDASQVGASTLAATTDVVHVLSVPLGAWLNHAETLRTEQIDLLSVSRPRRVRSDPVDAVGGDAGPEPLGRGQTPLFDPERGTGGG